MITTISIRKAAIIGVAVFLLSAKSCHCLAQSARLSSGQAGYEAASWSTMFIDNPEQITVAASPNAAKQKAELATVKQGVASIAGTLMKK